MPGLDKAGLEIDRSIEKRAHEVLETCFKNSLHGIDPDQLASEDINCFLAHWIRISEILPWDRKSYLTHFILPRTSSSVIM